MTRSIVIGKTLAYNKADPICSPVLIDRINRLAGCAGHWLLIWDGEPDIDCSHKWHQGPEEHLATCLRLRWRRVSLGFVPDYCGYSDYSDMGLVGKANFNCLTDPDTTPDPFDSILTVGYGWSGESVALNVLLVPDAVIETIEALQNYPLISEDEHSRLEFEAVVDLWDESVANRVRTLQDLNLCIFAARRDSAPFEIDKLWSSLAEYANSYTS